MLKILSRIFVMIGIAALIFGTPPAYAIFGSRIARRAIATHEAKKMKPSAETEERSGLQAKDKADQAAEETGPISPEI